MAVVSCRHFSGYRPCGLHERCDASCPHISLARPRILVIHLGALGAVLRATVLLPALKRTYPHSHITWVTEAPAHRLLESHQDIDRLLTTSGSDLLSLRALKFDLALVVDKSLVAAGILSLTEAREVRGFVADARTGAILPANPEAEELWQLGLSNPDKFFLNQKPETQLLIEAMALGPYRREPYIVSLTQQEQMLVNERRRQWLGNREVLIGLNTGCSPVIPYKRWTVEFHRQVIGELDRLPGVKLVLLGGPEDSLRNQQIGFAQSVVQSPTTLGLRDGLCSTAACDLVISGDSLGMHMAIALQKWVIAWFGPTCAQEIDLFDRGVKLAAEVPCAPCWKRICSRQPMCYDRVSIADIVAAVRKGLAWKTSLSKPHFSETSSFLSP